MMQGIPDDHHIILLGGQGDGVQVAVHILYATEVFETAGQAGKALVKEGEIAGVGLSQIPPDGEICRRYIDGGDMGPRRASSRLSHPAPQPKSSTRTPGRDAAV